VLPEVPPQMGSRFLAERGEKKEKGKKKKKEKPPFQNPSPPARPGPAQPTAERDLYRLQGLDWRKMHLDSGHESTAKEKEGKEREKKRKEKKDSRCMRQIATCQGVKITLGIVAALGLGALAAKGGGGRGGGGGKGKKGAGCFGRAWQQRSGMPSCAGNFSKHFRSLFPQLSGSSVRDFGRFEEEVRKKEKRRKKKKWGKKKAIVVKPLSARPRHPSSHSVSLPAMQDEFHGLGAPQHNGGGKKERREEKPPGRSCFERSSRL